MTWDAEDLRLKDDRATGAIVDMTPAMAAGEKLIVQGIEKNFASQASAGESWAPLADSTLMDRAKKGFPPGPILVRTGSLRADATANRDHDHESAHAGFVDGHPTAGYHMSEAPRSKIPMRDALAQDEATLTAIDDAIATHLERNFG